MSLVGDSIGVNGIKYLHQVSKVEKDASAGKLNKSTAGKDVDAVVQAAKDNGFSGGQLASVQHAANDVKQIAGEPGHDAQFNKDIKALQDALT